MIVGRHPRIPVLGGTVLSKADYRRGAGTIVDSDTVRYWIYWRGGGGTLCRHTRGELAMARIEYGRE
jgi:hypothetical protein